MTDGLLLAIVMMGADAPAANAPVAFALEPVSAEALHGCEAGPLERAVRSSFGKARRFRLVSEPASAQVTVKITDCGRGESRDTTVTTQGQPVKVPSGSGAGFGGQSELGVRTGTSQRVTIRARLAAGTRFIEVDSGAGQRTLRDAVDALRRAVEQTVRDRGRWLTTP